MPIIIWLIWCGLWIAFWTHYRGVKTKDQTIVEEAKKAGRITTAHFVSIKFNSLLTYEYEAEGRTYLWRHVVRQRVPYKQNQDPYWQMRKFSENDFPDLTFYWPEGHPEKADVEGSFGWGAPMWGVFAGIAIPCVFVLKWMLATFGS